MKVVLANPPWEIKNGYGVRSNSRWPHMRKDKLLPFPIYIGYAASVLEDARIDVKAIDAVAEEYDSVKFVSKVANEKPDFIFLETSTPTIEEDLKNAEILEEKIGAKIFMFGAHVTIFHNKILDENKFLDGIIRGEFEYAIRDIVEGKDLFQIEGLTVRVNGDISVNRNRKFIENLDELPYPAWHQFNLNHYDTFIHRKPSVMLITSRGCPFYCTYCLWPDLMYGHKQRFRSAKNVCDEIGLLIERYSVREIKFDDDTFALNKQHVSSICDEIMRRGYHKRIVWNCFGHIAQVDEEIYSKMAAAGCRKISFGIESGSQRVLDSIKKSIKLDKAKNVIQACRRYGIQTHCDFMLGFPYETKDDIEASIKFAQELDPDYIQVSYSVPYPGTRMYEEGLKENFLAYPDNWKMYSSCEGLVKAQNITRDELEKLYLKFWRKFYLRPRYLLRMLRKMFKSKAEFLRVIGGAASFYRRFLHK